MATDEQIKQARERAAQAWCFSMTEHIEMDPALAEAFAVILLQHTEAASPEPSGDLVDPFNVPAQKRWAVENCPPLSEWRRGVNRVTLQQPAGDEWRWFHFRANQIVARTYAEPPPPGIDYRQCVVTREERAAYEAEQEGVD